ncbi:haloacid dehalogenase [Roseivivax halodurans JCM 10272]|uniref:Haloacid dehalogenase n=1 Tax=Roseivivax halodurans JCM 10272 TaxID=1449350 RepID=X7ECE5_9RHOB|nr:HAD family phosphatase [Roseivivax halodurans]ETX13764.1 haloacid dehalogenase [Roseivivax halodurans JCM 10272]
MSIEAVVFDIGNVLIEWQPERHFDAVIGREARERLFAEVDLHDMNDRIDRGHDFRAMVYETAGAYPDWSDEIRLWHDSWLKLAGPEIPHSVRLLRALRSGGTPVFALSNFGIGTFALAEPQWPFLGEFDRRYISGHMGLAKPDADIFAAMEADCGIAPGALLFTDDRTDNIATAAARGWQTHHFDGPEGWARRLVAEGLLTEAAAR